MDPLPLGDGTLQDICLKHHKRGGGSRFHWPPGAPSGPPDRVGSWLPEKMTEDEDVWFSQLLVPLAEGHVCQALPR